MTALAIVAGCSLGLAGLFAFALYKAMKTAGFIAQGASKAGAELLEAELDPGAPTADGGKA